MQKENVLALYNHGSCGSAFFAGIDNPQGSGYRGTCPNPHCNKPVALSPTTLFYSIDQARRAYIRKTKNGGNAVFWQS